ncbi:hypothetical protein CRYUN_Cryun20dG0019800 [Craigia yunnanensis]
MLEPFGCTVLYNSRKQRPFVSYLFYSNVYEFAADSDAIIICCGLTAETRHIINRKVMLALVKQVIIIDISSVLITFFFGFWVEDIYTIFLNEFHYF